MHTAHRRVPLAALFVYFKTCIAHNPDPGPSLSDMLSYAVDPSRHWMIVVAFFTEVFSLEHWGVLPAVLPFYLLVAGAARDERNRLAGRAALRIVGYMMIGFYLFFLLIMWGLPGTLQSTFDRGMLQLWPPALLGLFLLVRAPAEDA